MTAEEVNRRPNRTGRWGDVAVGPAQVLPPRRAEHAGRRGGFRAPLGDRAVTPHLPFGEIAEPDLEPFGDVPGDGAAETDFQVIGMWAENEQIDGHLLRILYPP